MINKNKDDLLEINSPDDDLGDEIDLSIFINPLLRNKFLLAFFCFGGLSFSLLIGNLTKPTWRSEFQIILSEKNKNTSLSKSRNALLLGNLGVGQDNELLTEVEILKSPSVLMNTFDFLKNEKLKKGEEEYKNKRFKNWKNNNFEANLIKNTVVLNVAYQDQDKDLVIPVLKNITQTYQDYSGRNKIRNFELSSKYYQEQIEKYKNKSLISMNKADSYALKYSLRLKNPIISRTVDGSFNFQIALETQRIDSKNRLILLNQQLKKIKNMNDNPQEVLGVLSGITGIDQKLSATLQTLNTELALKNSIYKEQSSNIRILNEQIDSLILSIKEQMIGFVKGKIENENVILKSLDRDPNVLQNYKKLLNESTKDSAILNSLESEYQLLKLEQAKIEDPWELITNPTLLPLPVEPNFIKLSIQGLFFGTLAGSLLITILNKYQGKVYDNKKIRKLISSELYLNLPFNDEQEFDSTIELISKSKLNNLTNLLCIIVIGDIPNHFLDILKTNFEKHLNDLEVLVTKDLRKSLNVENNLVLIYKGITKENELFKYSQNFKIMNRPLLATIVIQNSVNNKNI